VAAKRLGPQSKATRIPLNPKNSDASEMIGSSSVARYMPDAKECGLLLLRLIEAKEGEMGRGLSRFRVAELSLRRLWGRHQITPQFVGEVNEWLFRAGRVLFFAGNSYGVIVISAVESWSRLTSKSILEEVDLALAGEFDFGAIEHLLSVRSDDDDEEA
jgi:hypothetical protein